MRSATRVSFVIGVAVLATALLGVDLCQAGPPVGGHPGGGGWHVAGPGMGGRGMGNYWWGWGGGYDSWATLYRTGHIPTPPYFALHPPVYYSQPVPRTYGYSPHAYPGWVPTPEIVAPQPQTIINPHVVPQAAPQVVPQADELPSSVAVPPKVTYNPFVKSPVVGREEKLARVSSP